LGRADEAVASLRAAIEADPTNAAAHQKLAEVLESLGRTDEARKEMAKALD
jgi:Flp pilus assembly protein TadD